MQFTVNNSQFNSIFICILEQSRSRMQFAILYRGLTISKRVVYMTKCHCFSKIVNLRDSESSTVKRLLYELKGHRARKHQKPPIPRDQHLQGGDKCQLLLKYSDVIVSNLGHSGLSF